MKYLRSSAGSALGPKLLGTYETEIHGVIEEIISSETDLIINIGAGEGYYAIGLLVKMPQIHMHAFEADSEGVKLINSLAELNSVPDRLKVYGLCDSQMLGSFSKSSSRPLIIMDVEGAEKFLLDPKMSSISPQASILVEVHDYLAPGVSDALLTWYRSSHEIRRIVSLPQSQLKLPSIPSLSRRQVRLLADEMRPEPMEWFWMTPRTKA